MERSCVVCGGSVSLKSAIDYLEYNGKTIPVPGVQYFQCQCCGEEFADSRLHKHNSTCFADAKRAADSLLKGSEIRDIRVKYSITQSQAAKIFGGGVNAFSKYERGEVIQSKSMDKLMRVADRFPQVYVYLCEMEKESVSSKWARDAYLADMEYSLGTVTKSLVETVKASYLASYSKTELFPINALSSNLHDIYFAQIDALNIDSKVDDAWAHHLPGSRVFGSPKVISVSEQKWSR
ncbi:type II toxin-antitoxin system MqsA family antitoxin [Salinicola halophyticus]|uniref:type II toxin-antitoxin system MqsA family antitoxin n=1 Tax=Salinicola halophyticus TaxID=1808881 RepID=UPI000DA1214F|nr:type II toxin-antitoxin system MqsA family antitoxin [Salinicola halophyticus]